MSAINIYVNSENLITIMQDIARIEGFKCNFHALKTGAKINPEAENFFITRNFPAKMIPDVRYILCSHSPHELSNSQIKTLFDIWPEPLTPSLITHFFRGLIAKIKSANHTEAIKYQKRLLEMAQQDYLTGLATRWYLHDYAENRKNEPNLTCVYFDLDNFKLINDTFGHQEGDRALAATAEMMQREFPDGFCARMGGDEFMIVIPGKNSAQEIYDRVDAFMHTLLEYYSGVKTMKNLSVSAGISQKIDGEEKSIDQLIHESDIALYEAKNSGRACCKIYDILMEDNSKNELNYFLIDYENVHKSGFNGIDTLKGKNIICIFYSINAMGSFSLDFVKLLTEAEAKILYRKVETGSKNALDFQLSSYLGEIIAENADKHCNYFIVSKDKGFSSLIPFWAERNIDIKIVTDLTRKFTLSNYHELKQEIANLTNEPETVINSIIEIIAKAQNKMQVSNALNKVFRDSIKASQIYRAIKPLLKSF